MSKKNNLIILNKKINIILFYNRILLIIKGPTYMLDIDTANNIFYFPLSKYNLIPRHILYIVTCHIDQH